MTPASEFPRLAGRWAVWWDYVNCPIVDMAGRVTDWQLRKTWYHDRVKEKRGEMLITATNEWIDIRDAWIVTEIYAWPRWESGWRKPLPDAEFNELMTRSQP